MPAGYFVCISVSHKKLVFQASVRMQMKCNVTL